MKIHAYATQGDIRKVAQEIERGINVDICDREYPCTPLTYAAGSPDANLAMMSLLIEKGADVNSKSLSKGECTPLSFAIGSGNVEKIKFLLDAGADIAYRVPYNGSALVHAVRGNQDNLLEVLQLLIARGCTVDVDPDNIALLIASRRNRFNVVQFLVDAGSDLNQLRWDKLMKTISLGSLAEVKDLLDHDVDLTTRDLEQRTPFLLSLAARDINKAKLLLSAGANIEERGAREKTALMYVIEHSGKQKSKILAWLMAKGSDLEATDESGDTALHYAVRLNAINYVSMLLKNGANPNAKNNYDFPVIAGAWSVTMVRILVEAGANLSRIDDEVRQLLTGVYHQTLKATKKEYLSGRYRQFGTSNPEVMEVSFQNAMIRSNASAVEARNMFSDQDESFPVWCYQRFGRTITELPNGRVIEIGGEHEDGYDADFCIYNDVVAYQSNGRWQVFGYPAAIFPPTDFHTATLVEDYIYLIGNLGYVEQRILGQTQVYRLNWHTFAIERIDTTGNCPGWISRHEAYLQANKIEISGGKIWQQVNDRVDYLNNDASFSLDLDRFCWSRH